MICTCLSYRFSKTKCSGYSFSHYLTAALGTVDHSLILLSPYLSLFLLSLFPDNFILQWLPRTQRISPNILAWYIRLHVIWPLSTAQLLPLPNSRTWSRRHQQPTRPPIHLLLHWLSLILILYSNNCCLITGNVVPNTMTVLGSNLCL